MIPRLVRFAVARPFVVIVATLVMAAAGVWAFGQLRVEAYPDLTDPTVVVVTLYPGFAAEEVEQQVTVPIERALNNTPYVISRRSRTIFGLSVVELTFEDGTNDFLGRQLVLERLQGASLPDGVTPTLGPLSGGVSEFYRYVVSGPGLETATLREIQDWVIGPRLLQVPGVADVATFGGLVRQYEVQVDPRALDKYRLSMRQLADAVKSNNRNAGGALLRMGQQALPIRGSGLIQSPADLEAIVLDAPRGVPIRVGDVGRVRMGALPQTGVFAMDDEPVGAGGVEGIVLMRRGENPSEVLPRVREAVAELNASRLPAGLRIEAIHDRSDLVASTLHTVSHVLIAGFAIVVIALLAFLLSGRAALLTAVVIPLSLLFALVCMYVSGVSLSLLSIGALDFGIIVDGTIVMVERIISGLERDPHRDPRETIVVAAVEAQRPIVFSMLVIIAAYIPLLTLQRVERRLFMPMALTVCYALVGSLLLALTLIPALATYLFRARTRILHHPPLELLNDWYGRAIRGLVDRAGWVVGAAAAVVACAFALGTSLGTEFLPQLDEGVIWIRANLPAGISLEKSAALAREIRMLVRQSPEVRRVASQTGRNDSGTDPFGPNRNELLVDLAPYDTWKSGRTKAALVDELARRLTTSVPGAAFNFTQPIIDTATEIVTGSSADLAVIISGPDLPELRRLAGRTLDVLAPMRGAADTSIEQEADQPQLRIAIDRPRVARYGINVGDVQDVIDLALGGAPIGGVFEGERRFDIVARFTPESRASPGAIAELLIPTRDGARVPLLQLADIRTSDGATIIARRENRRAITVRTNIRGRDQGGFVDEAQGRFARAITLPPGYTVDWGGQFENFARAKSRLAFIMPITLAVIFVLLFVTFGTALDAGLVLLTVPFSVAGGALALWLRGMNLNVSAAVGFISLFGVAVMSGVLYISDITRRRGQAGTPLRDAVVAAARAQLRPVLLVIAVATLGMIPAMVAHGIGSDIQRPLATVVVGGLLSTFVLTPLALPAVYVIAERLRSAPPPPADM
ncbi:MAG TPA: CusA/CzcA family heavy metal efflux RND transporter [Methylomirabilota bacterium]|nr:CusA/CzcA family heavy metal efflux RND transporter [Methylomirabilota bacterium]